jgi:hypothetical protein
MGQRSRVRFNLPKDKEVEELLRSLDSAGFKPDLIILDTLARLMRTVRKTWGWQRSVNQSVEMARDAGSERA